jgi:hypothetical protein
LQRAVRNAVVVVVIILVAAAGGYGAYYYLQQPQPNIQATQIQIYPTQYPQISLADNLGTVKSGQFAFTANTIGSYALVFDNGISFFASKDVSVSYTAAGQSGSQTFHLTAGQKGFVNVSLTSGQQFSGTYTISGGSGNDIQAYIQAHTCTEQVTYRFVLVNAGPVSGFANAGLQASGQTVQSNKYFVMQSQQLSESGTVNLPDCTASSLNVVVLSQQKA